MSTAGIFLQSHQALDFYGNLNMNKTETGKVHFNFGNSQHHVYKAQDLGSKQTSKLKKY